LPSPPTFGGFSGFLWNYGFSSNLWWFYLYQLSEGKKLASSLGSLAFEEPSDFAVSIHSSVPNQDESLPYVSSPLHAS